MSAVNMIVDTGEKASKEFNIETMLNEMLSAWDDIKFILKPHKNTFILAGLDDICQVLDEHIVNTQAMLFSPFKKPFEERIFIWDATLKNMSDLFEEWAKF